MFTWLKKLFVAKEGNERIDPLSAGSEIVGFETKFPGVVVGKILEVNNHPNADRLKLAKIDVGGNQLEIVCGGPNVSVGQLVPTALLGTILPNGMKIKSVEIRGQFSQGMICAEDELGLGQSHEEIMVLKPTAIVGGPIDKYL